MMKKFMMTILTLSLSGLSLYAQRDFPVVPIKEIQTRSQADLEAGNDATNYPRPIGSGASAYSDTIYVVGVVIIPAHEQTGTQQIIYSSSRNILAIADTSSLRTGDWDFSHLYVTIPGSVPAGSTFTHAEYKTNLGLFNYTPGTIVKLLGRITEFNRTTQLELIAPKNSVTFSHIATGIDEVTLDKLPPPAPVEIADFNVGTWAANNTTTRKFWPGEKYELQLVKFTNLTVVSQLKPGNANDGSEVVLQDESGNQIALDNQTTAFRRATPAAPVGAILDSLYGYISHYNADGMYAINPRTDDDIFIAANLPPVLTSWTKDKYFYGNNENINLSIIATDNDGEVTGVSVNYRVGIVGEFNVAEASFDNGSWVVTLPGVDQDSALVQFTVTITDDGEAEETYPINDHLGIWVLENGPSISSVQFSKRTLGGSYLHLDTVTVRGIVTVDTKTTGEVYIQSGTGPWSGIQIFGTRVDSFRLGDYIQVRGLVDEFRDETQIRYFKLSDFQLLERKATLAEALANVPPVTEVTNDQVRTGGPTTEGFEGVLVKITQPYVINPISSITNNLNNGEILINEDDNATVGLRVDDRANRINHNLPYLSNWNTNAGGVTLDYTLNGADSAKPVFNYKMKFAHITGVMDSDFGTFRLQPRHADDFGTLLSVSVQQTPKPSIAKLEQNFPNPFNPATSIKFTLSQPGTVSLEVFNLIGQKVKTMINNQPMTAQSYTHSFDALGLSSGIYIYRLTVNNQLVETKKMTLVK